MKKLSGLVLVFLVIVLFFASCAKVVVPVQPEIVIDANNLASVKDGSVLAPNSIIGFNWTDQNGKALKCDFVLFKDGVKVEEQLEVESVSLKVTEEGNYVAEFSLSGQRAASSKRIAFSVNKLYEELYHSNAGRLYVEDLSEAFTKYAGASPVTGVRFYRLGSNAVPGTNETENVRERLALIDSDDDGVYDQWQVVAAFAQQAPALFPSTVLTPYGTAVIADTAIYEEKMEVWNLKIIDGYNPAHNGAKLSYNSPLVFATVGFDLNVPHTKYIGSEPDGAGAYDGHIMMLRERYNSDNKPVFSLEPDGIRALGSIKVNINAENVANFASIYDTRYMQICLSYGENFSVEKVEFGNFMSGMKDFTSYYLDEENRVLVLIRAFTNEDDETAPITENFASVTFEVSADPAGARDVAPTIELLYDTGYGTNYLQLFKDSENKNVDGFIIDYTPISLLDS